MAGDKGDNTVNEKMTAIANNIRSKTGGTSPLTLDGMASGVDEVYKEGKQAHRKQWWETYLSQSGHWQYLFAGTGWCNETFDPCVDLVVPQGKFATSMFYMSGITDLETLLKKNNVRFDTSKAYRVDAMFRGSAVTVVPEIDATSVGSGAIQHMNEMFYQCANLHTVRKLILPEKEGVSMGATIFSGCTSLANIEFEGFIQTNVSFSSSPLTVESMKSVITHLKDYAGTDREFTYTLTLKDSCKTSLEADTETVEFNGASYTYFNLITAKGWNLA